MIKHRSRSWLLGTAGAGAIAVTLLSATISTGASASPAVHHQARPHAAAAHKPHAKALRNGSNTAIPVTTFSQQFSFNTNLFCPPGTGNAPCDGNGPAGDYGTIDRLAGGYSNGGFGNYAPSTPALFKGYMALLDGTGAGNQGAGCPGTTAGSNPGEVCTGPFALFGAAPNQGAYNTYPGNGFTVTNDLFWLPTEDFAGLPLANFALQLGQHPLGHTP